MCFNIDLPSWRLVLEPFLREDVSHCKASLLRTFLGFDLVRITVFSSAIVIDVIVHCHTAGALGVKLLKTIVPIIVWLGFDPFRPVQNHIGSGAGNPAIDTFVLDRDVGHHV